MVRVPVAVVAPASSVTPPLVVPPKATAGATGVTLTCAVAVAGGVASSETVRIRATLPAPLSGAVHVVLATSASAKLPRPAGLVVHA